MEKRYIANSDAWFDEGSEAILIEYMHNIGGESFGNFEGIYTIGENKGYDTFWHKKGHKEGDKVTMREVCSYNEFHICNKMPDESIINKLAFDYVNDLIQTLLSVHVDIKDVDTNNIKIAFNNGFKEGFKYLDEQLKKSDE